MYDGIEREIVGFNEEDGVVGFIAIEKSPGGSISRSSSVDVYLRDCYFAWIYPESLTKIDPLQEARDILGKLTLQQAKELGISTETFENLNFKKKEDLRWKPEIDEDYWFIENSGIVKVSSWANDSVDKGRYAIANIYKTGQQAKKATKLTKMDETFAWIRNWAICNDDGWSADWEDEDQSKWYVSYDVREKKWRMFHNCIWNKAVTYMSEGSAERLVELLNR